MAGVAATEARSAWRVAACRSTLDSATIVAEVSVAASGDVTIGASESDVLRVMDWVGPSVVLIRGGRELCLAPGMRLNMMDDAIPRGTPGHHVRGTFEELTAAGVVMPIAVSAATSQLNIRVRKGLSVWARAERAEEQQQAQQQQ